MAEKRKSRSTMTQAERKSLRTRRLTLLVVSLILALIMLTQIYRLYQKNRQYGVELANYQRELEEQKAKEQELIDYEAYTKTDDYIAREAEGKLGMVHPNEIIFREKR